MPELSSDLINRVLIVFASTCSDGPLLWYHENEALTFHAVCSDFFTWGCSDSEPINTEEDVVLLEACYSELLTKCNSAEWLGEYYACKRRHVEPAGFMRKYLPEPLHQLFWYY